MMWICIGVVAVAFAAWMWWELKHPLDAWEKEDEEGAGDSTSSGRPKDLISQQFEKWHSEALDARAAQDAEVQKGQGAK